MKLLQKRKHSLKKDQVEFTFSFTKEAEEIKPSFKTTIEEEKILKRLKMRLK
jgi:hypothetical protein